MSNDNNNYWRSHEKDIPFQKWPDHSVKPSKYCILFRLRRDDLSPADELILTEIFGFYSEDIQKILPKLKTAYNVALIVSTYEVIDDYMRLIATKKEDELPEHRGNQYVCVAKSL